MAPWQLAQINVGTTLYDLDAPGMADFMAALDRINVLTEASPGFVWRLQTESGNATGIKLSEDPRFIVNMSVWETVEDLFAFAFRSEHRTVMVRRREWFTKPSGPYQALWWVRAGHRPPATEGLARLAHLREHGPTGHAFTFNAKFPPPSVLPNEPEDMRPEPWCVGWR